MCYIEIYRGRYRDKTTQCSMKSGGWPPGGCVVGVIGRAFLMCYFIDIDIDRDKAPH